jgi:N6-L-threonylcarbamoyladenine synthase
MLVLGIEASCDESAISIVEDGQNILCNAIFSQTEIHKEFGGVFPEYASRSHIEKLLVVLCEALKKSDVSLEEIDLIAVSQNPGLIGSLHMAMAMAKSLSLALKIPYIAVNHIHAHLISPMIARMHEARFPTLGVVLSGGHTFLALMHTPLKYDIIGTTIDDAIGEAFDKVGVLLGLSYPAGSELEKIALKGNITTFNFKPCKVKGNAYNFSFSGLKTKVLYSLKGQNAQGKIIEDIDKQTLSDAAKSFQHAALVDIVEKALKACKNYNLTQIFLGGGVTNNTYLRDMFDRFSPPTFQLFFPQKGLCEDNGAMIAALGYYQYIENSEPSPLSLRPEPNKVLCLN